MTIYNDIEDMLNLTGDYQEADYRTLMQSNDQGARIFQLWLAEEVLPMIQGSGGMYFAPHLVEPMEALTTDYRRLCAEAAA